jgi:hypothetical protein
MVHLMEKLLCEQIQVLKKLKKKFKGGKGLKTLLYVDEYSTVMK